MSKLKLLDYFQLFEGGAPHHLAAVSILEESMPDELLDHFADWAVCFRSATSEEYNEDKDRPKDWL
mgnify:CR=1 FL=1